MVRTLEPEVLQRALAGDEEAFTRVVETYQTPVYNLCARMLGDGLEAEDAAQETFWRAYQALNRYDRQRPFATWLLSIAAHYCIDQQRKRRLPSLPITDMNEELMPDVSPGPENIALFWERDARLHDLLDQLNPPDRAALILRYWYDFSEEEIATSLKLTVSAVKSRLHRARLLLAQRWQTGSEDHLLERISHGSPAI
jgi:RNA polymerase sigma-70 factor (ECF subfamily)